MDKKLIPEIERILARYNSEKIYKHYENDMFDNGEYIPMLVKDFEKNIDWDWICKNYQISYAFIYEYHNKLDMKFLYDNYVITKEEFEKIRKEEEINNRFEIMDL